MRSSFLARSSVLVAASLSLLALAGSAARAELIYGITDPSVTGVVNALVSFDSTTPGTLLTNTAITGLGTGQTLKGIDFRASNGLLYAFSTSTADATLGQLYTINLTTGALTTVGSAITLTGNTSARVSLDFNPVVDALRVVTGTGQSYRINATTGALIAQDTSIVTAGTGTTPLISDIAYTNNVVGATSTTLYGYDFIGDNLGTIGGLNGTPSPNAGTFNVVGNSGIVSFNAALGFDISGATGLGYIAVDDDASTTAATEFYRVNLGTGAFTFVGTSSTALLDISVRTVGGAAAPEPGSLALLGMGALPLLGVIARRRKNKTA